LPVAESGVAGGACQKRLLFPKILFLLHQCIKRMTSFHGDGKRLEPLPGKLDFDAGIAFDRIFCPTL